MTTAIQAWIAIVGGLATAVLGIVKYFAYQSRRDRKARVGQAFTACVDGLASKDETQQFAAAILLRRFFKEDAEQGDRGLPYQQEAVGVIAALLRALEPGPLQKLLGDGLAFAPSLRGADLQQCNLSNAYLGDRPDRRPVDLTDADLFQADLTGASLKHATAKRAAFYEATLVGTVFEGARLAEADFRLADLTGARFPGADLQGAKFDGADLQGARFAGAKNLQRAELSGAKNPPAEVVAVLEAADESSAAAHLPAPA